MMNNSFINMLNPQMQKQAEYHIQQAKRSNDPDQYVRQIFGYDPRFMEGYNLFNQQGIQSLNNFIASKLK